MNLRWHLQHSIAHLENAGGLVYSKRQLYYECCRSLRPLPLPQLRRQPWLFGLPLLASLPPDRRPARVTRRLALAYSMLLALTAARRMPFTLATPLAEEDFQHVLHDHLHRHGAPPGLLQPTPLAPALALAGREPDLLDYGLPRLLICEDPRIAAVLRANHVPLELSCTLLSLEEARNLPPEIAVTLQQAAGARIYLLHDATPAAMDLLADPAAQIALPQGIAVQALGLRPRHAWRLHLFAGRGPALPQAGNWPSALTAAEQRWLRAGWRTEVAAVPPLRLLRALRRLLIGAPPERPWRYNLARDRAIGFFTWPEA